MMEIGQHAPFPSHPLFKYAVGLGVYFRSSSLKTEWGLAFSVSTGPCMTNAVYVP